MRYFAFLAFCSLIGCTASPEQGPQNFEDLLAITDESQAQICALPLHAIKENLGKDQLEAAKAEAFNYDKLITSYADDPAELP